MLRALVLLLAALILPLILPVQALAHAQLRAAEPAAGAILDAAPADVVLTFNEPIGALQTRLFGPDGSAHDLDARADGPRLVVPLPDALAEGTHALSWRVMSDDGHPVGSTHVFSIGVETGAPEAAPEPVPWSAAVARGLLTLSLVMGVGGALWARLSQTRAPAATVWALRAVAPAALLLIATQAMDMAGTGAGALRSADAWDAALRSPVGPAAACAVLAGLLAQRRHRVPVFAAWGLAALSFAAAGHAARAEPVALMASLVLVHALAVTFWAGALPVLIVALRRADAPAQMQRFSALAVPMVALLVLSGAVLAWRQIGSVGFLTSTAYGWAFVTKMALLLGVLALAARHRLRMTPALAANESTARTRFGRSLRVELALMIALLAVTAAFRLTPPPRAITEAPASRSELHLHGREAMADIALIPGQPGQNRLEIVPLDGDFQPFTPLEVTLYLSLPEAGIERIAAPAEKGADGVWTAGPVHLPQGGTWDVVADILITDFSKELIGGEITLSP